VEREVEPRVRSRKSRSFISERGNEAFITGVREGRAILRDA
jgi:hypothetical protein